MPSHTTNTPTSSSKKCASSLCSRTLPTCAAAAPTMDARPATIHRTRICSSFVGLATHLVTDVANGLDDRAEVAELGAHATNMDVHGARPSRVPVPPRTLEQCLA